MPDQVGHDGGEGCPVEPGMTVGEIPDQVGSDGGEGCPVEPGMTVNEGDDDEESGIK